MIECYKVWQDMKNINTPYAQQVAKMYRSLFISHVLNYVQLIFSISLLSFVTYQIIK